MPEVKAWTYYWHMPASEVKNNPDEQWRKTEWGVMLIDNNGMCAVTRDYAKGVHHWPFGSERKLYQNDFRRFIVKCDSAYLIEKFFGTEDRKVVSREKTSKFVKEQILHERRHGGYTKSEALFEWGNIIEYESYEIDIEDWLQMTEISDASEYIRYDWDSDILHLKQYLLPEFKRMIQQELEAEKPHVLSAEAG